MVACDGRFELSEKNEGATSWLRRAARFPVNVRIYAWRQDERYQSAASEEPGFTAVEVAADRNGRDQSQTTCEGRIEITLENGCRISIRDDVDAGFVLELARGLAA